MFFWLYLSALLADQREIRKGDEESRAITGYVTKTAIFENSRCRTAAILKIALYPYLNPRIIRFQSNLVRRCTLPFQGCIFDKIIEIFQIQDGGRTPY